MKIFGNDRRNNKGEITGEHVLGLIVAAIILIAVGYHFMHVSVEPGFVAVVNNWNTIEDRALPADFYFPINPTKSFEMVDVRSTTYEFKNIAGTLTIEGVEIPSLDVSVTYHKDPLMAPTVAKTINGDPFDVVLVPNFMGILRDEIKNSKLEDVYNGNKLALIQDNVFNRTSKYTNSRGIILEGVQFRGLTLPPDVQAKIQDKVNAKTESEAMVFKFSTAQQQANITVMNANATSRANAELTKTLTPLTVDLRRLEVLEKLINNKNAMILDFNSGSSGGIPPLMLPPLKNS